MAVIGSGRFCYAAGRPFTTSTALEGDFMAHGGTNTASSSKAGYAAANVSDEGLGRPWRSNVTTASYVAVGVGSSREPAYVFVDGLNVADFEIRADSDGNLSTATHSQAVSLSGPDPLTGRYKYLFAVPGAWTAQTYWGVYIPGSTPRTDGTNEYQVGRIVLVKTLNEMATNWGFPYRRYADDANRIRVGMPGGRIKRSAMGEMLATFELSGNMDRVRTPSVVAQIQRYMRLAGDESLLHFENRDDYRAAALCERLSPGSYSEDGPLAIADVALSELP
jgi:hypothetical protein